LYDPVSEGKPVTCPHGISWAEPCFTCRRSAFTAETPPLEACPSCNPSLFPEIDLSQASTACPCLGRCRCHALAATGGATLVFLTG
jgi:hypothetical protein